MAQAQYPGDLEFIGYLIQNKLNEQSGTKKISNTITSLVGALVSIAAVVVAMPIQLPNWAYIVIVTVTTLATTLGVKLTPNGFSDSQVKKLNEWKAEYIDQVHSYTSINNSTGLAHAAPVESGEANNPLTAEALEGLVKKYLSK